MPRPVQDTTWKTKKKQMQDKFNRHLNDLVAHHNAQLAQVAAAASTSSVSAEPPVLPPVQPAPPTAPPSVTVPVSMLWGIVILLLVAILIVVIVLAVTSSAGSDRLSKENANLTSMLQNLYYLHKPNTTLSS